MKFWRSLALALSAAWLAGCAAHEHPSTLALTGDPLVDAPRALEQGPPRDALMWRYRAAVAALRRGLYDDARQHLDAALLRLDAIYGPDADAKKARSYFHGENAKTFIGEPYERVMAYYYRGLLYWRDGEADNARACFRTAALHDADTEEKKYAADYVLLDFLEGYASAKLGADGSDAFKRADTSARKWKPPAYSPKAGVLLFIDYGPGPVKSAEGEFGEQLRFTSSPSPIASARVKVAGVAAQAVPYDDLLFQATTRGGREMDHILGNKVVFKKGADTAGTAALIAGAVMTHSHRGKTRAAGAGLMGLGLLGKALAAATNPRADTRAWDNLPRYLSFAALELPPGEHVLDVEFLDDQGAVFTNLTKRIPVSVQSGVRDRVLYVNEHSDPAQTW
jgi:tetratricopeptide (TPR) repeat protein